MKLEEAKEEDESIDIKDCRPQTVTVHSGVIKISRVMFYLRVKGRKYSLICPKLLQPVLVRHQGAHCQMPGVLLFLCRARNHRSLFMGSMNRSFKIAPKGKKP